MFNQQAMAAMMAQMAGGGGAQQNQLAQKRALQTQIQTQLAAAGMAAKKPKVGVAAAPAAQDSLYHAEVRFQDAASTQQAVLLHGSELKGSAISVEADERSKDGTKILIGNLTAAHTWQDLKDFFATCGTVVFANIKATVNAPGMGEVRFPTAEVAQAALLLDGTILADYPMGIALSPGSKDGTKLMLTNLCPGLEWQQLKDFFTANGLTTSFVATSSVESGGGYSAAEVRYEAEGNAALAMQALNGSVFAGGTIQIEVDAVNSAKLRISGVCPGVQWQQVKDHFAQFGSVAFCEVTPAGGTPAPAPGAAMGKGGGKMTPQAMMMQMLAAGGAGAAGATGAAGGAGAASVGQARFPTAEVTQYALLLHGQVLGGLPLEIALDASSKDGTKVQVTNIAPGQGWQQLKDFFVGHGLQPNFVDVKAGGAAAGVGAGVGAGGCAGMMGKGMVGNTAQMQMLQMMQQMGGMAGMAGLPGKAGLAGVGALGKGAAKGQVAAAAKGKGGGGVAGGAGGAVGTNGEIRYANAALAQAAVAVLNGSDLQGARIGAALDAGSIDGTKVKVSGLSPGTQWQQLKDHFAQVGPVAFSKVN